MAKLNSDQRYQFRKIGFIMFILAVTIAVCEGWYWAANGMSHEMLSAWGFTWGSIGGLGILFMMIGCWNDR